jgi:hypothetical protein
VSRELTALKKFMEAPQENTKEAVEFFNKHDQYWKKSVFLDLLDFYYSTADTMADILVGYPPAEGK